MFLYALLPSAAWGGEEVLELLNLSFGVLERAGLLTAVQAVCVVGVVVAFLKLVVFK